MFERLTLLYSYSPPPSCTPERCANRYPEEMQERVKEAKRGNKNLKNRPDWYDKAQVLMAPFAAGLS